MSASRLLASGYGQMARVGAAPPPEEQLSAVRAAAAGSSYPALPAVAEAFYLFRYYHDRAGGPADTLLGDLFYSLAGKLLACSGTPSLRLAFSDYLAADTGKPAFSTADYCRFLARLGRDA